MQLVMRRGRLEGTGWYNFRINARLVINPEEQSLIEKYKLQSVVITEGDRWRDIRWALLISAPVSAFFALLLTEIIPNTSFLSLFILIFSIGGYVVYQQIREEVRVNDLLTGRDFKARSFIGLLLKEQSVRKASAIFVHVIEQARTWDEPEVINLEPKSFLSLLEGERAAT